MKYIYAVILSVLLSGCVCMTKAKYSEEKVYNYRLGYLDGFTRSVDLTREMEGKK